MRRMLALLFALILETASASPFRVLVFPHLGSYPVPQGREAVIDRVRISSDEVCNQYLAKLNSNHEWEKSGNLISSGKTFSLTTSSLVKTSYFECTNPFKIDRGNQFESFSYEGSFVALVDPIAQNKTIQIVNIIDPEKYIQGVVPAEVGINWPAEALKAQAVAARTYAWWTVLQSRAVPGIYYDLDDTVQYQAYLGVSRRIPATDAGVSDTANQVMKFGGKVIKAYFSADSGGKTESAENVFGAIFPYCSSKQELYDITKTTTDWQELISLRDIGIALSKSIRSIEISPNDVNDSGRVNQVTLTTTKNQIIKITGFDFRRSLKLRSTLFQLKTIIVKGKIFIQIDGKGYGHGVGMAQIGAKEYALQLGWTFDQILKFYYTDVTLESVNHDYFE